MAIKADAAALRIDNPVLNQFASLTAAQTRGSEGFIAVGERKEQQNDLNRLQLLFVAPHGKLRLGPLIDQPGGDIGQLVAERMEKLPNDQFVIVGYQFLKNSNAVRGWVALISAAGETHWSVTHGEPGLEEKFYFARSADASTILVGGRQQEGRQSNVSSSGILYWLDMEDGRLKDGLSPAIYQSGSLRGAIQDAIPRADGGWDMVGWSTDYGENGNHDDIWLLSTSRTGEKTQQEFWGQSGSDVGFSLTRIGDRLLVGGYSVPGGDGQRLATIARFDSILQFQRAEHLEPRSHFNGRIRTADQIGNGASVFGGLTRPFEGGDQAGFIAMPSPSACTTRSTLDGSDFFGRFDIAVNENGDWIFVGSSRIDGDVAGQIWLSPGTSTIFDDGDGEMIRRELGEIASGAELVTIAAPTDELPVAIEFSLPDKTELRIIGRPLYADTDLLLLDSSGSMIDISDGLGDATEFIQLALAAGRYRLFAVTKGTASQIALTLQKVQPESVLEGVFSDEFADFLGPGKTYSKNANLLFGGLGYHVIQTNSVEANNPLPAVRAIRAFQASICAEPDGLMSLANGVGLIAAAGAKVENSVDELLKQASDPRDENTKHAGLFDVAGNIVVGRKMMDGNVYSGLVSQETGWPNGLGLVRNSDGTAYRGRFVNGLLAGPGTVRRGDGHQPVYVLWQKGEPVQVTRCAQTPDEFDDERIYEDCLGFQNWHDAGKIKPVNDRAD